MALSAQQWKRLMNGIMLVGLSLVIAGVSIALFTDQVNQGLSGIRLIALLIGAGLFLLIPSKIFITLLLMMGKEKTK